MAAQDWIDKDFYKDLGVEKTADEQTIKKAYRKAARKYHPDQNPGDKKAEAKFKEVSEAYSVLSDKTQRAEYDQIRQFAGGGARFAPGSGGASAEDLFGMFGGGAPGGGRRTSFSSGGGSPFSGINLDDLFGGGSSFPRYSRSTGGFSGLGDQGVDDDFYNQWKAGGRTSSARPVTAGEDIAAEVTLPFRTAAEGDTVELTVGGRNVKTRIPAGIKDGAKVRVRGKGLASGTGGPAGDLVLTVHVSKHPVYMMSGNNLRLTVPVTFVEAALGATIEVPKLDGTTVKLKVPAGTPSGRTLRVKGAGVAASKGTGDLLVTVNVEVPTRLNAEAKEKLTAFDQAVGTQDPRQSLMAEARR